jgi:hypothetical protein
MRQVKRVSGNPQVMQGVKEYSQQIFFHHGTLGGCSYCKNFEPHYHPERLDVKNIPSKHQIFVFAHGDLTFYNEEYVIKTLEIMNNYSKRKDVTFYLQTKNPTTFNKYLDYFMDNVILLTTIETNRDEGYSLISKAPLPSKRYKDFLSLNYNRKVVTIEPIMDFDVQIFSDWIIELNQNNSLEYVWIGFNSKPKQVYIPEPKTNDVLDFINILKNNKIDIRFKDMRKIKNIL